MTKIILSLCAILTVFLTFFLFNFPGYVNGLIVAGAALAILASFRSEDMSRTSLIALDLLFMLLIMVVYRNTLALETMAFYIFFIGISLLMGSLEMLLFAKRPMHPALGLFFTVLFWAPLSVPIFFIVDNKLGTLGGVAVVIVLFFIAVRDIYRRKKENITD